MAGAFALLAGLNVAGEGIAAATPLGDGVDIVDAAVAGDDAALAIAIGSAALSFIPGGKVVGKGAKAAKKAADAADAAHDAAEAVDTAKDLSKAAKGGPNALPPAKARPAHPRPPAPEHGTFHVDPRGNTLPTPPGGKVTGSPDGRFLQARDAAGNPTGVRVDGPHRPAGHPDPRAQQPHGHVPGVTNPDGTPWLPIK